MSRIVFAKIDKMDNRTTLENLITCQQVSDLHEDKQIVHLMELDADQMEQAIEAGHEVYVPYDEMTASLLQKDNLYVYFDLANYPFYRTIQGIMDKKEEGQPQKGIFRYRRMTKEQSDFPLQSDLYVLFSLFGQPKSYHIKRTNQAKRPAHTILMVDFGEGVLAHIEYTIADKERVEWEWSGIRKILEFDSEKMRPFEPADETALPLLYSVDTVLETAVACNESYRQRMEQIKTWINGGDLT